MKIENLANRGANVHTCDTLTEMQAIVRSASEPWRPGDSVKVAISRAARKLDISYRRARTFWYAYRCAVRAAEADKLRQLAVRIEQDRATSKRTAAEAAESRRQDELVFAPLWGGAVADGPVLPLALRFVAPPCRWPAGPRSPIVVSDEYVGRERRDEARHVIERR